MYAAVGLCKFVLSNMCVFLRPRAWFPIFGYACVIVFVYALLLNACMCVGMCVNACVLYLFKSELYLAVAKCFNLRNTNANSIGEGKLGESRISISAKSFNCFLIFFITVRHKLYIIYILCFYINNTCII